MRTREEIKEELNALIKQSEQLKKDGDNWSTAYRMIIQRGKALIWVLDDELPDEFKKNSPDHLTLGGLVLELYTAVG